MSKYYEYALFDLRPIPEAAEANDKIFAGAKVWGIEVTIPALAERCDQNIDPQHLGGDHTTAAIELARSVSRPPAGVTLATIRPDLDSVGAMAIFEIRHITVNWSKEILDRIQMVAAADKFEKGDWPGPRDLPTIDNPHPEGHHTQELAAIAKAIADFKVPINDRVAVMERWITTGEEPEGYREMVEAERMTLIASLATGTSWVEVIANGKIAAVESTHRAATMLGYLKAPVVVALNPQFRIGDGEPHKKFTICTYRPEHANIGNALKELATLEPGWGGSPTIGGSPQGVGSNLTIKQVVEVVKRHLA